MFRRVRLLCRWVSGELYLHFIRCSDAVGGLWLQHIGVLRMRQTTRITRVVLVLSALLGVLGLAAWGNVDWLWVASDRKWLRLQLARGSCEPVVATVVVNQPRGVPDEILLGLQRAVRDEPYRRDVSWLLYFDRAAFASALGGQGAMARVDMSGVRVPIAFMIGTALAFVLGTLLWRPSVRYWRQRKGRCRSCAYDLSGNVSGTCPECGTLVSGQDMCGE